MATDYATFAAAGLAGVIELRCLELSHPLFAAPIRIVKDHIDWTLTLESSSPGNGQTVAFFGAQSGFGYTLTNPASDDTGRTSVDLKIDDVDMAIYFQIEAVRESSVAVTCILRRYLSDNTAAPFAISILELGDCSPDGNTLSTKALSPDYTNLRFPWIRHTIDNSPGLRGRA